LGRREIEREKKAKLLVSIFNLKAHSSEKKANKQFPWRESSGGDSVNKKLLQKRNEYPVIDIWARESMK
jgi:hypothetical protein